MFHRRLWLVLVNALVVTTLPLAETAASANAPAASVQATAAGTHAQGIADSGETTFASPLWPGLNVIRGRVIVPYDVALRPVTDTRRQKFEAWLTNAQNAGVTRNVGLARIPEPERPGYGRAPDETTYRNAFAAFVAAYGPRVDAIGPWNEPNFNPGDGSRLLLPGGQYYLDDPDGACDGVNPLVANCGPRMAAYYYRWAAVDCPSCLLAAGEFAGTQSSNFIQKYKRHLGTHRPSLWSVHNYADVIRYQVSGEHTPAELNNFLDELYCTGSHHCVPGTDWSSGNLWIGATGAYYQLDCRTHDVTCDPGTNVHVLGETSQCQAAAFINRFSNVSAKITRIYFYTFADGRSGDNTGIVNANGTVPRKAYYAVRDRAESCTY
ncbi:hypothetical protein [Catellatospora tritici]|uniref:hypothetical protein n=1 Tax=Catellatospora tritici TaxID=2851566 RepID=UPI001C2D6C0E|nr:hypothetical protein [Catellatospora tritici]MBV1854310.1 hypothetical protein [Catellatospora tritici]